MKLPWSLKQSPTVAFIAGLGGLFTAVQLACAQPWVAGPPAPPYAYFSWWGAVASSADGSRLVGSLEAYTLIYHDGYGFVYPISAPIYVSADAGTTWTQTDSPWTFGELSPLRPTEPIWSPCRRETHMAALA